MQGAQDQHQDQANVARTRTSKWLIGSQCSDSSVDYHGDSGSAKKCLSDMLGYWGVCAALFASWRGRCERRSHITGQACPRILGHENHHRSKPDYYFMMGNSDLLAAFAVPMQISMVSSVKRARERMPAPRSIHGNTTCPRVFVLWSKSNCRQEEAFDGFPEGGIKSRYNRYTSRRTGRRLWWHFLYRSRKLAAG